MGDTEQVQMDNTPIFPAVRSAAPTVRRRRGQEINDTGAEQEEGAPVKGGMPTYIRVMLLLSLIPVMFYLPKVLSYAGDKVQKNQYFLVYLWSVSL